jgi:hypothetical protein
MKTTFHVVDYTSVIYNKQITDIGVKSVMFRFLCFLLLYFISLIACAFFLFLVSFLSQFVRWSFIPH